MKKFFLYMALMLGSFTLVLAQNSVTGKVRDDSGYPLVGVNIVEKSATNGTTTHFDGNF